MILASAVRIEMNDFIGSSIGLFLSPMGAASLCFCRQECHQNLVTCRWMFDGWPKLFVNLLVSLLVNAISLSLWVSG